MRRLFRERRSGADDFQLYPAVLRPAVIGTVIGDRLLLAFAFRVNPIRLGALADQIGLHRFGTADRQALVVCIATDTVGVSDDDDEPQQES